MSKTAIAAFITDLNNIASEYGFHLQKYGIHLEQETFFDKTVDGILDVYDPSEFVLTNGLVSINMDKARDPFLVVPADISFAELAKHYMHLDLVTDKWMGFNNSAIHNYVLRVNESMENGAMLMEYLQEYLERVPLLALVDDDYNSETDYLEGEYNGYAKFYDPEFNPKNA